MNSKSVNNEDFKSEGQRWKNNLSSGCLVCQFFLRPSFSRLKIRRTYKRHKGSTCNWRAGIRKSEAIFSPFISIFESQNFWHSKSSILNPNKMKQGNRTNTSTCLNIAWYKKKIYLLLCPFVLSFDRKKANNLLCMPIYLIDYSVKPESYICFFFFFFEFVFLYFYMGDGQGYPIPASLPSDPLPSLSPA